MCEGAAQTFDASAQATTTNLLRLFSSSSRFHHNRVQCRREHGPRRERKHSSIYVLRHGCSPSAPAPSRQPGASPGEESFVCQEASFKSSWSSPSPGSLLSPWCCQGHGDSQPLAFSPGAELSLPLTPHGESFAVAHGSRQMSKEVDARVDHRATPWWWWWF